MSDRAALAVAATELALVVIGRPTLVVGTGILFIALAVYAEAAALGLSSARRRSVKA